MITMKDMDALNRAHEQAIRKMGDAAVVIAEAVLEGVTPTDAMLKEYHFSRLGVLSTMRDIEYCMTLELNEIL